MDQRTWVLDESAHAGAEHLDAAYVAAYEHKAGVDPSDDLALLRSLGLNDTSVVVDLGAGTGAFALAAAALCQQVVAVDVSAVMLARLRAAVAQRGLRNVACVQAGFLTYTHQGPPADVVYSRHALHLCWLVRSSARSETPRPPHRGRLSTARRGPVSQGSVHGSAPRFQPRMS